MVHKSTEQAATLGSPAAFPRDSVNRLTRSGFFLTALALLFSLGCQAKGVGDPCMPEQVPEGGFVSTETYLETSSVQCRTRVCMVYQLSGDPRPECTPSSQTSCATEDEVGARVYCTCRCDAPDDPNASVCKCPSGYSCQNVLDLGGPGVRGSYCVLSSTISSE